MDLPDIVLLAINLDRAPERWENARSQLEALNLSWKRIAAIDGRLLGYATLPGVDIAACSRNLGRPVTSTELACAFSHNLAMTKFLKSPFKFAVILEDDFVVREPGSFRRLLVDLTLNGEDWDYVKLSGRRRPMALPLGKLRDGHRLCAPLLRQNDAAAYMLNRKSAEIIAAKMYPIDCCFDHLLDQPWRYNLQYRIVMPAPIFQNLRNASTIGDKPPKFSMLSRYGALLHRTKIGLKRLLYNARQGFFLRGMTRRTDLLTEI